MQEIRQYMETSVVPMDTKRGASDPQRIWLGDTKFPSEYGSGMQQTGDVKIPMAPVLLQHR